MAYIESTLLPEERVILLTRPHWIVFLPPVLILLVVMFIASVVSSSLHYQGSLFGFSLPMWIVIVGLLYVLYAFAEALIIFYFSEYGVTNRRVLMKVGMIQRNSLELFLEKVEAIHVNQSILARILNYGVLVVIGTGGSRDFFRWVPDPLHFRKVIQQQIDKRSENQ